MLMLDQSERWISFNETFLEPSPHDADYTEMSVILDLLYEKFQTGECVKMINNNTAALRITDFEIDQENGIAFILFQYSDKSITNPVFSDLETGELRTEPKLDGEGIAVSAHYVISLKENDVKNTYVTILENIPGIGRTRLDAFLASEFREICKNDTSFEYTKNKIGYRPIPRTLGLATQSLKDDLNNGYLSHISLIKHTNSKSEFDEDGYTKEKSRIIEIKLSDKFNGDDAHKIINLMKKRGFKNGYELMKVKFKNEKTRTINVETRVEDAFDVLYTRQEKLSFDKLLEQCVISIDLDIKEKMTNYMKIVRLECKKIFVENNKRQTRQKDKQTLLEEEIKEIEKKINELETT
jgi:hypothetical protein